MYEIATFRLREGVSEDEFLAADARVQTEFYYQQDGLMRRTVARGTDGEWLEMTHWATHEAPDRAADAAKDDPNHQAFTSLVERRHIGRYEPLPG